MKYNRMFLLMFNYFLVCMNMLKKTHSLLVFDVREIFLHKMCGSWFTVIYFAQLELVGVLKVIRLRNDFQPYHWTPWASRISEKMKKTNKGHGGQTKAREWPKTKFQKFFTILGSLGVSYCMISIFLNFKVVKAKKAALLAGAAFFYLWKFILSKLVL